MLGLTYLGLLKVRRLGTSGRYYVVVPLAPIVRSTAGRRVGFVAEGCAGVPYGLVLTFRVTVTFIRRSDEGYWYRLTLSTCYPDLRENRELRLREALPPADVGAQRYTTVVLPEGQLRITPNSKL